MPPAQPSKTAKSAPKNTSGSAKAQQKPTTKKTHVAADIPTPEPKKRNPDSLLHQFIPCVFVVLAIMLCVFLAVPSGAVGEVIRICLFGLFGWGAWVLPIFLVSWALMWKKTVSEDSIGALFAFSAASVVMISALLHAIVTSDSALIFNPITLFLGIDGKITVGGALGGILSNLLMISIQKIATYILLIFAVAVLLMFTFGLTPRTIILYFKYYRALSKERARERAEALEEELRRKNDEIEVYRGGAAPVSEPQNDPTQKGKKRKAQILDEGDLPEGLGDDTTKAQDTPADDGGININMFAQNDGEDDKKAAGAESDSGSSDTLDPILDDNGVLEPIDDINLRHILIPSEAADVLPEVTVDDGDSANDLSSNGADDDGEPPFDVDDDGMLEASTEGIGVNADDYDDIDEPEVVIPKKVYRFPPISMLAKAAPINEDGAQQELAQNAKKLVDTLMSFKVKTKILSVSRGPTITRYELSPEAGTRVRSIANLVDDIALNLATGGVRIEAPIPGKSAVGIEVPNKTVATVRLRELIDTQAFKNAESKINVALGVDVAGSPVYCNLAKMPHMLIAGATGMGKSVCINSIISSILYKANPDEVKLILVDPKKVEFNIYNGLPHLLVPVVSDPQKAAGSLNWAVGEMERRFTLIDEVGVRDIGGYNEITKNDPDREPMPYVVIIIDELADLMMTAKDTVETSICRLAQKARAAGMHLVIGTQRPSVDVITGLIKANIPSRIAFTVASQVDSKTIIDIGGAEKLIGRGDMLYSPVGFMKPLRVQGAFVSDEEVRSITDFIRTIEYDSDIIDSIEREAERCAQSARSGAAELDDEDGELSEKVDPKFRAALELAVNSGKISTSLLQRHLSIGYGRAAKIIDRMQALGYVSPPDGSKPREVLITKQMYIEMVVSDDV